MPRAATTSPRASADRDGDAGEARPRARRRSRRSRACGSRRRRARARPRWSGSRGVTRARRCGRGASDAPGQEDLAEGGGVGRDVDLGPVAGARAGSWESTWATWTTLVTAEHRQVHGLLGVADRPAPSSGGRAGPARPTGRAGRRTARRDGRRRSRRSSSRSSRPPRSRAASIREVVDLASPVAACRSANDTGCVAPRPPSRPAGRHGRVPVCRCRRARPPNSPHSGSFGRVP